MAGQLLTRERNLILVSLIALALAAWAIVIWRAGGTETSSMSMSVSMDAPSMNASAATMSSTESQIAVESSPVATDTSAMDDQTGMSMGLTMNMGAALFLGVWVAMMVAMMFPTAAPMILAFARVQSVRQSKGEIFVPTWLFVLAYITLWASTGFLAFGIASLSDSLANNSHWLAANAARIGGAVLVVAGLYQLSPLKNKCLAQCRTPTGFIMTSWQEGRLGAIRMGLKHGAYCLGCCFFLFVILFPLGMMNVAAMALITALIFAEKSLAVGTRVAQAAAVGLVVYGAIVLLALPDALPTNITI